jgi:DNA-binding NtrC family response regulator
MASATVLIVDDEQDFAEVLAARMEGRGLEADIVDSGEKAIEQVKKKSYDAIILDLAMPGLDGIETLKLLLADQPELQVILLTGRATLDKGIQAVKLGAVEFLEKPADIETLVGKVKVAQMKKMELSEQKLDDMISDILKKKGW